jgi:hypothetical protein
MAQVPAADLVRAVQLQINHAVDVWGRDDAASVFAGNKLRPYTPPDYARVCYIEMTRTFFDCARFELENSGWNSALVDDAQAARRLLSEADEKFLRLDPENLPRLTLAMNDALGRAYDAGVSPEARAFVVDNDAGEKCLEANLCSTYWRAMQDYALNASATRAVVTNEEKWREFKRAAAGAASDVGEVAGRIAGELGEVAGRVAGGAAGGVIKGLGVASTVIVLGLGYVAWRVL